MKDCLTITKIIKNRNRIDYIYDAQGEWKELLNLNMNMFVEYDDNIENVPDSIAVIPLLCNVLPISWVFNLDIYVDVIDKSFYDCIQNIRKGYSNMYPMIKMQGNIEYAKLEENKYESLKTSTLFSGGVDAFNTLFSHIEEKPILVTVWGSDISLKDENGWNRVKTHHINVGKQFQLDNSFIKTNFRDFINYSALSDFVSKIVEGEWWHEFQHGIGILGLVAPMAYINKVTTLYIASSFTERDKGKYTCASDPTIDNYLKFANCKVIHDGYKYNRQDKIHNICQYLEKNGKNSTQIRVCWKSDGGQNCCECEKCYRTIMGIIAEKKNPKEFGFDLTSEKRKKMMKKLPKYVKYNYVHAYLDIQNRFLENYSIEETPKDLLWFRNIKIKDNKPHLMLIKEKIIKKIKKIIKKMLRKK